MPKNTNTRVSMLAEMTRRWKPTAATGRLNLKALIESVEGLHHKQDEIREAGDLSEKGRQSETRRYAASTTVMAIAKAERALAKAKAAVAKQKADLLPPAPDPQDVAAAVLRSDLRRHLLSLAVTERTSLMMTDITYFMAAREAPATMMGIGEKTMLEFEGRLIAEANPQATADIEAGEESLVAFEAVLRAGRGAVQECCEFPTAQETDEFFKAYGPKDRDIDAAVNDDEKAWAAQTVTSAIDRLDESQRREIRDKIFQIDLAELGGHHGAVTTAA